MRRYFLPACLGVLLLGVTFFASSQKAEADRLRASLTELGKQRDALRKQVWDLQKGKQELAARTERESALATDETRVAGDNARPAGSVALTQVRPDGGAFANAMNSPEVQQLMAIQQKAGLDGRYAALFKKLNLSPADLEKFKGLLVEKQLAITDVLAAARNQGLTGRGSRDEIRQLVEDTQAEIDGNIRTAMGESAYAEYKNYETTLPQRAVVSQLEQRLSYSSTPLNDTQTEQLVQILAANTPATSNGNRGNLVAPLVQTFAAGNPRLGQAVAMMGGTGVPLTDTVIAQAQGVLMPTQVAALQGLQQEQQAAAQLMQQMRSTNGRGPQPSDAPQKKPR